MNELAFINFQNIYSKFRTRLKNIVNDTNICSSYEDCYLINKNWNEELAICFINNKKKRILSLQDRKPIFINSIQELIKNIHNCRLISKTIINFFYKKELKTNTLVKYYGGNGKLIIEFKDKFIQDSILLIKPLEDNQNENNIFFISTNRHDKSSLYNSIITKKICTFEDSDNKSIIFSFKDYIQNINRSGNFSFINHKNLTTRRNNSESAKQKLLLNKRGLYFKNKELLNIKKENDAKNNNENINNKENDVQTYNDNILKIENDILEKENYFQKKIEIINKRENEILIKENYVQKNLENIRKRENEILTKFGKYKQERKYNFNKRK